MKRSLFITVVLLAAAAVGTAQQSGKGNNSSLKNNYIQNQGYLTTGGLSLGNQYGDSLKGFDASSTVATLQGQGVEQWEILGHVEHLKREFIKNKYYPSTSVNTTPQVPVGLPNIQGGKKKGNPAQVNVAPCVNEGFESTAPGQYNTANAVQGWTIQSRTANSGCPPYNDWQGGSPVFWIQQTPLNNWPANAAQPISIIPHSPLGGTVVAQLNDDQPVDYECTRVMQTFPVTASNALFQFAYAGYWQLATGHNCCQRPGFEVRMYDCNGQPLSCVSLSLFPGSGCASAGVQYTTTSGGDNWTNWQVKSIDFTPYIGTCITVEFMNTDCSLGGHWGAMLLDVLCGGQNIGTNLPPAQGGTIPGPVSFCNGSNVAVLTAPTGYATYQWVSPISGTVPAPQGTMSSLQISNPVPGQVYTVNLVTASGCQYKSLVTLAFSTVNIAGLGNSPSCPNGSSGSATVAGNGSGAGYTYTWVNSSNQVVGSQSVVTGLVPGVYSVMIGGAGAAGCGTAMASTTITAVPPSTNSIFKPYCGSEAYLSATHPGTGFKWYNNTTLQTGSLATGPNYTVSGSGLCNGCNWWVSYTTSQGCKDSTRFTLVSSPPGLMTVPPVSIKKICPDSSNGRAVIQILPANGAPPGFNTYSIASTGTTAPYTSTFGPTSLTNYTATGLSPGTYTVVGFDGSCKYNTTFNVVPVTYSWTVTPPSTPTLCPGQAIPAAVNFPGPIGAGEYSYTWTPSSWLVGGNGHLQNTIISPTVSPGTYAPTVFTVVVTPTVAYCPSKKQFTIDAVNPPMPTLGVVPPLCDIFQPFPIQATPGGGTFVSGTAGLINSSSGAITPTGVPYGVHQYTYNLNFHSCYISNTSTFEISQYFSPNTTSTVSPLCVTSPVVNLMNIVQQTNGVWSGTGVNGGVFNPQGLSTGNYALKYKTVSSPNAGACPDSSALSISVTNTSVPLIVPVSPFCTNHSPITMTANPAGGGWSGANISVSGVITPSTIIQSGMHGVTYTVADGPCLNTASTQFMVHQFNSAAITGAVPKEVCFSSSPVNLMNYVTSTVNGTWSGPNTSAAGVLDPLKDAQGNTNELSTGQYVFTYSTTSSPPSALCPDVATVNISILNPTQPEITLAGPFCSTGSTVQLKATPANEGGKWTETSYLSKGGAFDPKQAGVGSNPVQFVVGKANCFKSQTALINVEAFVSAALSTKQLPDLCNTGVATNLMPYTMNSTGGWKGPGILGASFDPKLAGKGEHTLTYTTSSLPSGLCPDQATVAVSVFSLATPNILKVPATCNNSEPFQLTADVQGGEFGGVNTNAVNREGLFVPGSAIVGENVVNYTITSGPCVAYAQTTVTVEKFISAAFTKIPPMFCSNDGPVNLNSFVKNPGQGQFALNNVPLANGMFDPTKANQGENNLITYMTQSFPTGSLCPDQEEIRVEVVLLPELMGNITQTQRCAPSEAVFNMPNNSNPQAKVYWTPGDGSPKLEGNIASHAYGKPGTYTVMMTYALKGCEAQLELEKTVEVFQTPDADFAVPEEILISSPEIQLQNLSSPLAGNSYTWMLEGAAVKVGEIHPIMPLPAKLGKYQVTLIAVNIEGCRDEITKTIEVKNDFNVFIPTSFSPNFDNLNDVFRPEFSPYGLDLRTYEMEIFDRWGHLIFHTNDSKQGWNGSAGNKGDPLKEGVYIYKIRYKDLDGNAYNKMGHVTLLH